MLSVDAASTSSAAVVAVSGDPDWFDRLVEPAAERAQAVDVAAFAVAVVSASAALSADTGDVLPAAPAVSAVAVPTPVVVSSPEVTAAVSAVAVVVASGYVAVTALASSGVDVAVRLTPAAWLTIAPP